MLFYFFVIGYRRTADNNASFHSVNLQKFIVSGKVPSASNIAPFIIDHTSLFVKISLVIDLQLAVREKIAVKVDKIIVGHACDIVNNDVVALVVLVGDRPS